MFATVKILFMPESTEGVAEGYLRKSEKTEMCMNAKGSIHHRTDTLKKVLLIYGNESGPDLKRKLDGHKDRYIVTETICAQSGDDEIRNAISRHDAVMIDCAENAKRNGILKYCYERGIQTYVAPTVSDIILSSARNVNLLDTPLKQIGGRGLSPMQRFIKRGFDLILCLAATIPAVPLMLVITAAIKIQDGGPVFYQQKRVTKDGKVFDIFKFRSMVVDAESGGYDLSMRANGKDTRITKVGAVIRSTHMDELPQLLNILKGDMSFVGPRPERVEHVEAYSAEIPEWHFREKVKAGLTGYAQVYGKYNTSAYDKLRLDLLYIENYSLLLDARLIFQTVPVLFRKESTEGFDTTEGQMAKDGSIEKRHTKR